MQPCQDRSAVDIETGPSYRARVRAGGRDLPVRHMNMAQQRPRQKMGQLTPRFSFFLNPHRHEAFTRCPRCTAKTRVRKMVLVIHVDAFGLVLLRKTCRLCVVCEMLIVREAEMDDVIDGLGSYRGDTREYVVLGTLDVRTWRRGLSATVTSDEVAGAMADFKACVRVDVKPRHWSRSGDATE